jgi:penicillin-binding protein 2
VAVLVEHGGHGGSAAAPIARLVIERWLQLISPKPVLMPQRSADAGQSATGASLT